LTEAAVPWTIGRFFVEAAFSESAKTFADMVIGELRDEYVRRFEDSNWMSRDVKNKTIKKVKEMKQLIGYPTKVNDLQPFYCLR
jgi:endothelin-converting enzyme